MIHPPPFDSFSNNEKRLGVVVVRPAKDLVAVLDQKLHRAVGGPDAHAVKVRRRNDLKVLREEGD